MSVWQMISWLELFAILMFYQVFLLIILCHVGRQLKWQNNEELLWDASEILSRRNVIFVWYAVNERHILNGLLKRQINYGKWHLSHVDQLRLKFVSLLNDRTTELKHSRAVFTILNETDLDKNDLKKWPAGVGEWWGHNKSNLSWTQLKRLSFCVALKSETKHIPLHGCLFISLFEKLSFCFTMVCDTQLFCHAVYHGKAKVE